MQTETNNFKFPYTVVLTVDEFGDVIAKLAECPGCMAHGENVGEALSALKAVMDTWLDVCKEANLPIPEPVTEETSIVVDYFQARMRECR